MNEEISFKCVQDEGTIIPVINFNRCEGKGECAALCPVNVFELRRIDTEDYDKLGRLQKLKLRLHGMQVAYTPNADACKGCGLCVSACPEKAITLKRA